MFRPLFGLQAKDAEHTNDEVFSMKSSTVQSFPHRKPLAIQVAEYLGKLITEGRWDKILPPERQLAEICQVSRTVVRSALQVLQSEKIIELSSRSGAGIIKLPGRKKDFKRTAVHFLTSESVDLIGPEAIALLDELRKTLYRNNIDLEVISDRRFEWAQSDKFLERIVAKTNSICWILNSPNKDVQNWFQQRQIPALLSGSPSPESKIPYVAIDWHGVGSHAAGLFVRSGHKNVALLLNVSERPGDTILKKTFFETIATLGENKIHAVLKEHARTPSATARAVQELLDSPNRPSAIFASDTRNFVTGYSVLLQNRISIPKEISLVLRQYSVFCEDIVQSPTCYKIDFRSYGRCLGRLAQIIAESGINSIDPVTFVPTFQKGQSFTAMCKPLIQELVL